MTDPRDDEPLGLDAWEPQLPPSDFAERVLAQVRAEAREERAPRDRGRARRWVGRGSAVAIALAAAVLLRVTATPSENAQGEAIAKERTEVSIGGRARAVLEPGAEVKWNGDDVVQAHGDVFYRVEPGARFRVHTPAGEVEVKGTCFAVKIRGEGSEGVEMNKRDVKSGVIGGTLTALAFVAVYEGKVAVSHAGERMDLGAGESAQVGGAGVGDRAPVGAGEKAFDAKIAEGAASKDEMSQANANLVDQVGEYRKRLEAIVTQKVELEKQLKTSEEKLAAAQSDGAAPRTKGEYDLSTDDWTELAKKGQVKYRVPCLQKDYWTFSPDKLDKLGLAPQDATTLRDAYERSYKRVWDQVRPLCIQAVGNPEVVDKIGASSCPHIVYDVQSAIDGEAAKEAHTQAAEIRAGLRPEPGPNDKVHPVTRMFLILTSANKAFEADLAKSFGPDEAHRLAHSNDMCNSNSNWGGGKKREPAP
ncbi:MAG: FecR domain-containing protein [Labilithrix sp.]|nr:FecR domain-containing protein [Labilithrix sp.]